MPLYSTEVSWQNNSEASLSCPHKFCRLQYIYMTVAVSANKFIFMAIEIEINIFVPLEIEITI